LRFLNWVMPRTRAFPIRRQGEDDMSNGWKKAGLIGLGAVLGVLLSLNFSAVAQRETKLPIPYEDLQLLSAVFGKIKSDYVEPVSDEKLIKEAINGMVHGLDPHSDFLDAEAFKDLQISTQGKFGGPFWARLETDLHLQYWVDKLTHFFPFDIRKTPYYSGEELHDALDGLLEQPEHIEWKGIELFWGRKPRG